MTRQYRRSFAFGAAAAAIVAAVWFAAARGKGAPDAGAAGVPVAKVTRGVFLDTLAARGEVRAARSTIVLAPVGISDLRIVDLVRSGAGVKAGDVVVRFDPAGQERLRRERASALAEAQAELERVRQEGRRLADTRRADVTRTEYEVERARLDTTTADVVAALQAERAELALGDAKQRLDEARLRQAADEAASRARIVGAERKRDKAKADLDESMRTLARLSIRAPIDGIVRVTQTWVPGSGRERDLRPGDSLYAGQAVVELPDLATLHVVCPIEEEDRARVRAGQTATVTVEAIRGRTLRAKLSEISALTKTDYTMWPPTRNFTVTLALDERDADLRPGMSAAADVVIGEVANVLMVPRAAVFQRSGRSIVYLQSAAGFVAREVDVERRGTEMAVVASGVVEGEVVALREPEAVAPAAASNVSR